LSAFFFDKIFINKINHLQDSCTPKAEAHDLTSPKGCDVHKFDPTSIGGCRQARKTPPGKPAEGNECRRQRLLP
jgi:hypothetical protein